MNVIEHKKYGVVVYGPVSISHLSGFMDLCAKMLGARKSSLVLDGLINQQLPAITVNGEAIRPLMTVCRRKDSDAWRAELGIEVVVGVGARRHPEVSNGDA
jgi:hypothetical protein